jgi:hypothetical protein
MLCDVWKKAAAAACPRAVRDVKNYFLMWCKKLRDFFWD